MDSSGGGIGNIATGIGQILTGAGPVLGTGAQIYGQQNAAEAVEKANNAAITNQTNYLGNIGSIYSPYTTGGAGASAALSRALGTDGSPADYSGFENMPGYKFAIEQGTQAIQRQAAANGSAYTPNTAAAVGQYVTGTAMQDYNTYIQQLSAQADRGASAANSLGNITYNTGANTSQLMSNTGQSQAGFYTGVGGTLGGALGGYVPGGYNGSGVGGYGYGPGGGGPPGYGGVTGGIGNIIGGIGKLFSGGGNNGGMTANGQPIDPNTAAGLGLGPVDPNYSNPSTPYVDTTGGQGYQWSNGYENLNVDPSVLDNSGNVDYSGYTGG